MKLYRIDIGDSNDLLIYADLIDNEYFNIKSAYTIKDVFDNELGGFKPYCSFIRLNTDKIYLDNINWYIEKNINNFVDNKENFYLEY